MTSLIVQDGASFDLEGLERIVGARAMERVRSLAGRLRSALGNRNGDPWVWHINSSAVGGGVADILACLVPFSNQLGVTTQWLVIGGDEKFFNITKTFHNALQGSAQAEIDDEMVSHYRRMTRANAEMLESMVEQRHWQPPEIIVFHDPQPAALIPLMRRRFPDTIFIWRGHIQFDSSCWGPSHPGRRVWDMLVDLVNQCDAAIFHLPEQVPPGISVPVRCILPSINPLGYINRPVSLEFIDSTLKKYGMASLQDRSIPLIIQNGRFDSWKDPQGVIQAFREAQARLTTHRGQPHLVCVGPMAGDDPEAQEILRQLGGVVDGDGTVHLLPMLPHENLVTPEQADALRRMGLDHGQVRPQELMELEINALQTRADIIVAKSLREGFGLSVAGAGFHGKPRIVSQVGGLAVQVTDKKGNHYACLVGGNPDFSRDASISMTRDWMVKLLSSPSLRKTMGAKAKRHVIHNFLPHRHLGDYFELFLELRLLRHTRADTA